LRSLLLYLSLSSSPGADLSLIPTFLSFPGCPPPVFFFLSFLPHPLLLFSLPDFGKAFGDSHLHRTVLPGSLLRGFALSSFIHFNLTNSSGKTRIHSFLTLSFDLSACQRSDYLTSVSSRVSPFLFFDTVSRSSSRTVIVA